MTTEIPYGYCHCGCGQKTDLADNTHRSRGWVKNEPKRFINNHHFRNLPRQSLEERFWTKVAITANPDKCWEWQAYLDTHGYGHIGIGGRKGKEVAAHRVAWELTHGEIPNGLWVLHKCDNRSCCNPNHLFLGTPLDNSQDMVAKGRGMRGEGHYNHKLTAEQVQYIRTKYASGAISQRELADEMGIYQSAVSRIVNKQEWKHLPDSVVTVGQAETDTEELDSMDLAR